MLLYTGQLQLLRLVKSLPSEVRIFNFKTDCVNITSYEPVEIDETICKKEQFKFRKAENWFDELKEIYEYNNKELYDEWLKNERENEDEKECWYANEPDLKGK